MLTHTLFTSFMTAEAEAVLRLKPGETQQATDLLPG